MGFIREEAVGGKKQPGAGLQLLAAVGVSILPGGDLDGAGASPA